MSLVSPRRARARARGRNSAAGGGGVLLRHLGLLGRLWFPVGMQSS